MVTEIKKVTGPNPIDIFVGKKLRERRMLAGISQTKLADSVGLTFQQIQKYEKGTNRMGASRLYQFSQILKMPINYFYDGMTESASSQNINLGFAESEQSNFASDDVLKKRETLNLVRSYYQIQDPKLRHQVLEIIKTMAKSSMLAKSDA